LLWKRIVLSTAVITAFSADAQSAPSHPRMDTGTQPRAQLTIVVLDGENAINDLHANTVAGAVVEVRDTFDRPVPDAEVTFELPANGPGGFFGDDATLEHAVTNARGQAAMTGMVAGKEAGRFAIRVTAQLDGKTGGATIHQMNSAVPVKQSVVSHSSHRWKWIAVTAAGGATAGALLILTSGHGSAPPIPTTVTFTPGPITVTGPK
jgi:hypothetical protein